MFSFKSLAIASSIASWIIPQTLAYHAASGPICLIFNAPCTYAYLDSDNVLVTVTGYCGGTFPYYCADNGAQCFDDDECYNGCGTDGVCGGEGSICDTTDTWSHGQDATACNTPTDVCDIAAGATEGVCVLAASGSARRTRSLRERSAQYQLTLNKCGGVGQEICEVDGQFRCVDTMTSLESCGGCPGENATDCTQIDGAVDVSCVSGVCVVETCEDGLSLANNECI